MHEIFLKEFSCKNLLIFFFVCCSLFTVLNVLYHAFSFLTNTTYFKKIMLQVFFLLPFIDIEIKLDVNEIMEIPVCVQKNFFCTKITFLHFWYIFIQHNNTTFYVFSMWRPLFISIIKWQVNIVLQTIIFASIQCMIVVYFN